MGQKTAPFTDVFVTLMQETEKKRELAANRRPPHWHVQMTYRDGEVDKHERSVPIRTRPRAEELARMVVKDMRARGLRLRGTMRGGVFAVLHHSSAPTRIQSVELVQCEMLTCSPIEFVDRSAWRSLSA